jgi:hypothetical protein
MPVATRFLSAFLRLRVGAALLLLLFLGRHAVAGSGPDLSPVPNGTGPSLAEALAPDGTLRPGATGSFNARNFAMSTAPDGRPVFRAAGTLGAGDERWQDGFALPNGINGDISTVVQSGTDVYVGGYFIYAGGLPANNVAKWNGTTWSSLGTGAANGVAGIVYALAVAGNGDVYVGGGFITAGGLPANNVAKWNGTTWNSLGTGAANGVAGRVYALAISGNGDVYVGGNFTQAGSVGASCIAKWDGSSWSALGAGVNTTVRGLEWANSGELYTGGTFTQAGGSACNGIAKWNGAVWTSLGSVGSNDGSSAGVGGALVRDVAVGANGDFYVGGTFVQVSATLANNIAKWDGSSWSPLGANTGNGLNGMAYAVAVAPNGAVYVGGDFTGAGSVLANRVAKWDGTAWTSLGAGTANGVNDNVRAIAVVGNAVYVGGAFTQAGGRAASYVAKWDGTAWSSLGTGVNYLVYALAEAPNGGVYVGGDFSTAGGIPAKSLAKWDGISWSTLGPAQGFNNGVRSFAVAPNGDLYAGGSFRQAGGIAANFVAKWNGTAWTSLGSGTANGTSAFIESILLAPNGDLYVGGGFASAGGVAASRIAKWNGTAWSTLPSIPNIGLGSSVAALALTSTGTLYAGGPGGVLKWNGVRWSTPGTGVGNSVNHISVLVAGRDSTIFAGGGFTTVGDGSKAMSYFGVFDPPAAGPTATTSHTEPEFAFYPNPAHGTASLTVVAAAQARPVQVFDATGRRVRQQVLPATATTLTLDLAGLRAGVYVVRLGALARQFVVE